MLVMAPHEQLPVTEAKAGKAAAWDALFRRYQMPLYVYVFELVRNEQSSLDLVQETFIAAAKHIGSLEDDAKFGSWLFGIAHQRCIQLWRKSHRAVDADSNLDDFADSIPCDDAGPDDLLIRSEDQAQFDCALESLPLAHRSVLLLHFVEEFSLEQIAQITGSQLGTVKSRMHYAKKALRKLMEKQPL